MRNDTHLGNDRAAAPVNICPRVFDHIEIFATFEDARASWDELRRAPCLSTPFQEYDFLETWQRHIGNHHECEPFLVTIFDAENVPLAILPFITTSVMGLKIAEFAGGKHATFNMGIWRRTFATNVTIVTLDQILADIHARRKDIDLIILQQQPHRWNGCENPLSLFVRQASVNNCPRLGIINSAKPHLQISNSFRRRLRSKEKKLESQTGYRHTIVKDDIELKRIMDAFFRLKPQRMALQKLPNMFSEPCMQNFVTATCESALDKSKGSIDVHALETDDEVLAIFIGVADGVRFSMMYNTYTLSANSRYSPGLILIRRIVDHYAMQDYRIIDLGIGDADYKSLFCKEMEPIFDSFVGLSVKGKILTPLFAFKNRMKRKIKRYPALVNILRGMECVLCKKFFAKQA